ncbi:hypothetical protein BDA96_08G141400 [Sorghum bicolor]|uniref:Acidic protein n=2 Tax=Sorghum bicolor TaxID=4558 RepID=A0A1B6PDD0_SORBI|nr:hypothetical protein BDA96_08G141400 [Sorghum bicolor]KXG23688.1 hypothetical protein SORBI_3008G128066 [Sorghum bicolor]OQU79317.1 hypothetical protein SORBI_3008G128200 [Sorghum bicolor]
MASRAATLKMATATALVLLVLLCMATSPVTACTTTCQFACGTFAIQVCGTCSTTTTCITEAEKVCIKTCTETWCGKVFLPCL